MYISNHLLYNITCFSLKANIWKHGSDDCIIIEQCSVCVYIGILTFNTLHREMTGK